MYTNISCKCVLAKTFKKQFKTFITHHMGRYKKIYVYMLTFGPSIHKMQIVVYKYDFIFFLPLLLCFK